jgi:hypothetical protein
MKHAEGCRGDCSIDRFPHGAYADFSGGSGSVVLDPSKRKMPAMAGWNIITFVSMGGTGDGCDSLLLSNRIEVEKATHANRWRNFTIRWAGGRKPGDDAQYLVMVPEDRADGWAIRIAKTYERSKWSQHGLVNLIPSICSRANTIPMGK